LWSSNGQWWFQYRGTRLYLTSEAGPTMTFPWHDFRRAARVTGKLTRQDRPSLDQNSGATGRDIVPCFVIRTPRVEYLEDWLAAERRGDPLYPSFHTVRDGVPELLAKLNFRRSIFGNETNARGYAIRNEDAINFIIRNASATTRDVLARRMD